MVYCSFAAMFIAQAYNVPLSFERDYGHDADLMLASKGIAGGAALGAGGAGGHDPQLNIPVAGILLDGYRPFPRHGALRHQRVG